MSLTVVSTPIGNYEDITLRAIETLKGAEAVICEEIKPASILLKKIGVGDKPFHQLNEHSKPQDLKELLELCRTKNVALISDCGTPGFCDPGAELVNACFSERIRVDVNPGASSLMTLISLSGVRLKDFYFVGFLPAENSEREKKITEITKMKKDFVIMDTPYRLNKTVQELASHFGDHKAVLGIDLTGQDHRVVHDSLKNIAQKSFPKAPFVLLVRA